MKSSYMEYDNETSNMQISGAYYRNGGIIRQPRISANRTLFVSPIQSDLEFSSV